MENNKNTSGEILEPGIEPRDSQETRQGPAFAQIMADEKEKRLFMSLLADWDSSLRQKLEDDSTFELSDYGNIENMRQEYLRRKERAEQAKQLFSPELLSAAAIAESDLGAAIRLMGAGGPERAQEAILSQIDSYAFQDVKKFEQFVDALETLQRQQIEKEKWLAQIDDYTKLYNIPSEAYHQVMNIPDPATREEALRKLIRKNMNWFDRVVVSDDEVKRMAGYSDKNEEALNQSYQDIGQSMEELTASLLVIADNNPDVKKALSGEVRKGPPEGADVSFAETRDFVLATKGYDEQWEEFTRNATVGGRGWDALSPAEQSRQRSHFLQNVFGGQYTLGGLWRSAKTLFQTAYVNAYRAYL